MFQSALALLWQEGLHLVEFAYDRQVITQRIGAVEYISPIQYPHSVQAIQQRPVDVAIVYLVPDRAAAVPECRHGLAA